MDSLATIKMFTQKSSLIFARLQSQRAFFILFCCNMAAVYAADISFIFIYCFIRQGTTFICAA